MKCKLYTDSTGKLAFDYIHLSHAQFSFIEIVIFTKIDKLRKDIDFIKDTIERCNGRDLDEKYSDFDKDTVGQKLRFWQRALKDFESLLPELEEMDDAIRRGMRYKE